MRVDELEATLTRLCGHSLTGAGQAASMPTWQFGGPRTVVTAMGVEKSVGEHALHIQCPWRLVDGGAIVVGSPDTCLPADPGVDPTEWQGDGPSRFRVRLEAWLSGTSAAHREVVSASADLLGGFRLSLAGGGMLEAFPDDSMSADDIEFWRLFRPSSGEGHFVVGPHGATVG